MTTRPSGATAATTASTAAPSCPTRSAGCGGPRRPRPPGVDVRILTRATWPTLVLLVLALAIPVRTQEPKKEIRAIVQEVDVATGTITVLLAEGGRTRADRVRTYNLLRPDLPVQE